MPPPHWPKGTVTIGITRGQALSALDLGDVEWPRDRKLSALPVDDCQHQTDRGQEYSAKG
jgi:hypothetical protein